MGMHCPLCGVTYEGGHSCMRLVPVTFTPTPTPKIVAPDDEFNRVRDNLIKSLEAERDAALLQISDLRRVLGPYSSVQIALKKYQELADEADDNRTKLEESNRLVGEYRKVLEQIADNPATPMTATKLLAREVLHRTEKRIHEDGTCKAHGILNCEMCK